ncbi:XRE family transcriptional regulator (plasmid) [Burkholderia vietnamiensis]|uniref:Putative transcriptional regulator, XRE family n=1 Tax=Burkholderia vietnamiensis (strain G4 / LMG 22486) TaxID=269482 RepID=A4JTK9_BURVG|nr:putative transcriptional regulator, XRE family [Burkholderia vietnamiensis G4]MCB4350229.1 XRE family transcriptional regulator [Burkholderia vietnamiensis]
MTTKKQAAAAAHTPSPKRRVSAKTAKGRGSKAPKQLELAEAESQPEVRNIEGLRLIRMIKKTLVERDLPERTISDIMGVTPIYWNSMTNGNRTIKSLGKDKLSKVAEFLGLPTIQVYILADFFDPSDFMNSKALDEQMWLSIVKMTADTQWTAYAPTKEEWQALPIKLRAGFAALYEREFNRALTRKAQIEVPELAGTPPREQESTETVE